MKFKFEIRDIIVSWDFLISAIFFVVLLFFLPSSLKCDFLVEVYGLAISVIAIVFSIFFASSAIILSGDNDFIKFLEKIGGFSFLISAFKFTLFLLFIALIYSMVVFALAAHSLSINKISMQSKWLFSIFVFLFSYSLLATICAANNAFRFQKERVENLE
jgi:hypothetical protein